MSHCSRRFKEESELNQKFLKNIEIIQNILNQGVQKRKKSMDARRRDLKEQAKAEKDMQKRKKKFKKGEKDYENAPGSER